SQTSPDDALQIVRHISDEVLERLGFLASYCADGRSGGLTLERPLTCQHLVENDAESENIAARVGLFSFQLFRGHVWQRADDVRRVSESHGLGPLIGRLQMLKFRNTKVQQL